MKVKIKRKKHFKMKYIVLILVFLLLSISTSYSLLTQTLYINGKVTGKYGTFEVVPVRGTQLISYNGFTVNVLLGNSQVINYISDTWDSANNTLITNVTQGDKTLLTSKTTVTINIQIKNISDVALTNGYITASKNSSDTSSYVNPKTYSLSATRINSGETITFTTTIEVRINRTITTGYYADYVINFKKGTGTVDFHYRFLFVNSSSTNSVTDTEKMQLLEKGSLEDDIKELESIDSVDELEKVDNIENSAVDEDMQVKNVDKTGDENTNKESIKEDSTLENIEDPSNNPSNVIDEVPKEELSESVTESVDKEESKE